MSRKEKIKILEKAIRDYSWSYYLPIGYFLWTYEGLCRYFKTKHNIYTESIPEIELSLYELYHKRNYGGYWFTQGKVKERLRILKRALEKVKLNIEQE